MLVLTRRVKQSIMINDEIEITVVAIDGDQVKIGIDAPKHIDIHRKEIYIAIQDANKAATVGDLTAIEQLNTLLKK